MFTMDPIEPVYFDVTHTRELAPDRRYRELVARLINHAEHGDASALVVPILTAAYPSGVEHPERRDIAAFERDMVSRALTEADDNDWCDGVHEALFDVFSPVWDVFPGKVSPLFLNDKFHHPNTGLAWNGDDDTWHVNCRSFDEKHCACGHQCADSCRQFQGMVGSSHSHRFHFSGDDDTTESCMTCGAMYTLMVDERNLGYYVTMSGEPAQECTGRTDMAHGLERHCEADNGRQCAANLDTGVCEHTDHDCPCLLCDN